MRKVSVIKFTLLMIAYLFVFVSSRAQLLCEGSLGDPVVNITFGSGSNPGPPLAAATTNYQYYNADACPNDGQYTVTNATANCFGNSWHTVSSDHTGNTKGYFMLVNASFQPSDFYVTTVHGLCPNTTFEFAAWILNMLLSSACGGAGIQPNITFKIETTTGTLLDSFNTGNIPVTATPTWNKYGFLFQTPAGISDVVVRMTNNAPGGCGNDLALDDITFRPCGPMVNATIPGNGGNSSINLCEGDPASFTFNATVSAGYSSPAYQWQISTDNGVTWQDIPGATGKTFIRNATANGNYEYRLTVAEAGNINSPICRVASNNITINVNALPVVSTGNDGPKCEGANINLNASGGTQYNWTGPDNFKAATQTAVIKNATIANQGKYYVTVTNTSGCSRIDSTTIVVNAKPAAIFNISSPTCEKNAVNFTDQSATSAQKIIKWNWNFGDGSASSAENPSNVFANAGNYSVSLIVQTDSACTDTLTKQITVHDLPQPNFILPKVCLADPFAAFTDSSTIADNTEGQFSYLWNFGDPSANAGNPNTSTQKNPQHVYTAVGIYNVHLTVTSKDGCVNDTLKPFTVNGSVPKSQFTIINSSGLCTNQPVVITDASSVNFGSITKIEIYWDYQNDITKKTTDDNPFSGKQYSFQYPATATLLPVTYTIKYIVYSGISCVNESSQDIIVNASPKVQFDALSDICEEAPSFQITQAKEITGISGSGIYSGDGIINSSGIFDPHYATSGTHTVYYTFTAANGCRDSADQTIQVYPQPTVDAGPNKIILEGGNTTLNGSGNGNITNYLWTPDMFIDSAQIPDPTVFPTSDITYTLTVTSSDNCMNSDTVFVNVLKKPLIPNAFSPNGDGINDTWIIKHIESYPNVEVSVFNRYGQIVFHSIGYNKPWDGTYNGKRLAVGTYYYIIDRKVGGSKFSGSVTILR